MSVKKSNAGRKPNKRSEKVENAIKEYLLGNAEVGELAKKYDIDRSGLYKAIKSTESDKIHTSGSNLKTAIQQTKQALSVGLNNLQTLKNSDNKIHNEIADNIMSELEQQAYNDFKIIRTLVKKTLVDIHNDTEKLRQQDKMDLDNINKTLLALRTANQIIGIPNKTPLVAIQNNIQNNTQTNNNKESDLKININVIQPPKKKKESEIIEVISDE